MGWTLLEWLLIPFDITRKDLTMMLLCNTEMDSRNPGSPEAASKIIIVCSPWVISSEAGP